MQWIIFTQFLVEWSGGRRPVLEWIPQANKWFNTIYKIYLSTGMLSHGFSDIFVVTNNASAGTVTNYLDPGAATNVPARYYRARLVP